MKLQFMFVTYQVCTVQLQRIFWFLSSNICKGSNPCICKHKRTRVIIVSFSEGGREEKSHLFNIVSHLLFSKSFELCKNVLKRLGIKPITNKHLNCVKNVFYRQGIDPMPNNHLKLSPNFERMGKVFPRPEKWWFHFKLKLWNAWMSP